MKQRLNEENAGLDYAGALLEKSLGRLWGSEHSPRMAESLRSLSPDLAHEAGRALAGYEDETLDLTTRRLLTIGVLAALGREMELRSHVRGAVRAGVAQEQIAAALLQVGFYAGIPAALDGFIALQRATQKKPSKTEPGAQAES